MACNRTALALSAVALLGAAPPAGGVDPTVAAALQALAAKDLRVATVAYRLQTSALSLCRNRTALTGLIVQDAGQYRGDLRPAVAAVFNLGDAPAATGIVPGGPADRAGIRAGDEVLALDGAPLVSGGARGRKADGDIYGRIVDRIAAVFARGRGTFTLRRGGATFTRAVTGAPACASTVQLDLDSGRNAGADGNTVTIAQGLLDFTRTDDELAFILGHELSHNILGHRTFLDSNKGKGLLGGGSTAAVLETERQADYYGLYLAAWAGYDVSQIAPFWQRISKAGWLSSLFADGSHPGNRTRTREIAREAEEIRAAQAAHRPLAPDYAGFVARGD